MDKQEKFVQMIEDVVELAKINGREATIDFLHEYFKELELEESQMQLVYDYMLEHNISVKGYDKKPKKQVKKAVEYNEKDEAESEYLNMYMNEVKRTGNVTRPLNELVVNIQGGDEDSRNQFVNYFLPIVIEHAKNFKDKGMSQSDLIQEGNIGVLLGMGELSGSETPEQIEEIIMARVTESMLSAIDELSIQKKTGRQIAQKADMLKEKAEELAETMNDKMTMQEMADYMDMDLSEIEDILRMTGEEL